MVSDDEPTTDDQRPLLASVFLERCGVGGIVDGEQLRVVFAESRTTHSAVFSVMALIY